jgi:GPH family glycoside/pentoside/hexuronide:cation symporter
MIIGALPLAVALTLLWIVPICLSDGWLFVWIVITFILFDSFITLTSVPYYAMTAELTDDYDERSSLTAFRMLMGIPAYMIGAAATRHW